MRASATKVSPYWPIDVPDVAAGALPAAGCVIEAVRFVVNVPVDDVLVV